MTGFAAGENFENVVIYGFKTLVVGILTILFTKNLVVEFHTALF